MAKENHLELKVGIFVVLGFIALTILIFSISDFSFFEKGKSIKVVFGFANGVKKAAPVRLAGVDVGSVKDVKVYYEAATKKTRVDIYIWVTEKTEIPADSKVWINQLGLLGEKYIEIIPGVDQEHLLGDQAVLAGDDPIALEQISEMISKIAKKLEISIDGFNDVVASTKNKESLEETLAGLNIIVSNIKEGKGTLGRFLSDDAIFDNLQDFSADLKVNPWKLLYRPPKPRSSP